MIEELCGDCIHFKQCQSLIYTVTEKTKTCDFSPSRYQNKDETNGILKTCQAVHTFCLQEGLKDYSTDEHKFAYQQVIIFLNREFGHVRKG